MAGRCRRAAPAGAAGLGRFCRNRRASRQGRGNEYAGPYAWDASVRSRLFLHDGTGGIRKLQRKKANFAPPDETIELEWRNGLYLPIDPARMTYGERLEAEQRRGEARQTFMDALDRLTGQGTNVSENKKAGNYAPRVMAERGLVNGQSVLELERAMIDLLNEGRLKSKPMNQSGNTRTEHLGSASRGHLQMRPDTPHNGSAQYSNR